MFIKKLSVEIIFRRGVCNYCFGLGWCYWQWVSTDSDISKHNVH